MEKVISYIGSKVKLYDFIEDIIISNYDKNKTYNFLDLFSGTNSVSNYIKKNTNWNIYANDLSNYSNVIFSFIYFDLIEEKRKKELLNKLEYLDNLPLISTGDIFNEFSVNGNPKTIDSKEKEKMFENQPFNSRMFFSERVGKKIDTVKTQIIKWINEGELTDKIDINILLTFLLHYADKNSNTTSVYGAYLKNTKKMKKEYQFYSETLIKELTKKNINNNNLKNSYKSYNKDILGIISLLKNELSDNSDKNIIYLDPPYSTRSYESNYHILEYISNLDFNIDLMKQNSKTGQRVQGSTNPFNSKNKTFDIFQDMIKSSLEISNNIYISYNTDGLMKQEDIELILNNINNEESSNKIELITHKKSYKRYKSSSNLELKKLQEKRNQLLNMKEISKENADTISKIDIELNKNKIYIVKLKKEIKELSLKENKEQVELKRLNELKKELNKIESDSEVFEIIWHFKRKED